MAPVARAVTNAEENRFIFSFGTGEGFITPRVPINRIFSVLVQIRAGFVLEAIQEGLPF
jgi:hypothetical protein